MIGREEIERRFGSTAISPAEQANPHFRLRRVYIDLAEVLDEALEDGRTKSLAFTQLEDSAMWAHKSLSSKSPLVTE